MLICSAQMLSAATFKGIVVDETTGEPLLGAAVIVKGSTVGAATGLDGGFAIKISGGEATFVVSYMSYVTKEVVATSKEDLRIALTPDTQELDVVQVVTKVNLETEVNLQQERIASNVAIENIGVREMSLKGLSNVEDGVKKMTGISIAESGQVIVRGLGDRYSITTLNGLPIASPNPDNKLAPLDIFPSMAVKNITVSKVYDASSYADYSGAHIDIATKNLEGDDFFSIGFGVGADFNTIGQNFYKMDNVSIFSQPTYDTTINSLSGSEYSSYVKTHDLFDTTFDVETITGLPNFKGNFGWGHRYDVGRQKLSLLATGGINNSNETIEGRTYQALSSTGTVKNTYIEDSYKSSLDIAALASAGVTLRESDYMSYTFFYARNASNEFSHNTEGFNNDKSLYYETINNISRIYTMMANQLNGETKLSDKLQMNWSGSLTKTTSDEPDNRQLLLSTQSDGLYFYSDTGDETNRMYTALEESEYSGDIHFEYEMANDNKLKFGVAYKNKGRDFDVVQFRYNLGSLSADAVPNIYSMSDYLTLDNLAAGNYSLSFVSDYTKEYYAASSVLSAFVSSSLNFGERVLVDVGVRAESSSQYVDYQSAEDFEPQHNLLESMDLFPSLNVRYQLAERRQFRFAASRTITRPSFLEMAPYEYSESYGAAKVVGNADIENGYNYNIDLRYEAFFKGGDMFSITGYYKYLDNPIERVTQPVSGAIRYSFENTEKGLATGVEFEARKKLFGDLRLGVNGSYMYTQVNLQSDAIYTNSERELQGASPYLFNADLTYTPKINERQLSLALLYNLQGPRIYAVGLYRSGDIIQQAVNTLNFTASYEVSEKMSVSLKLSNLLALPYIYEQYMPANDTTYIVDEYRPGTSGDISVSFKF